MAGGYLHITTDTEYDASSREGVVRAALGAVIACVALAAALTLLQFDASSTATRVIDTLRILAAGLFLAAGVLRLSTSGLNSNRSDALLGVALMLLGGVSIPLSTLVSVLASPHAALAYDPLARMLTLTVVWCLLLGAVSRGRREEVAAGPLLRNLALLIVFCFSCLALSLAVVPHALDALARPWFSTGCTVALGAGWFVVGLVLNARAEDLPWSGRLPPLLGCLSVASLLRATPGPDGIEWTIAGALLTAIVAALASHAALTDLARATRAEHDQRVEAATLLADARLGLTEHDARAEALRHDARNSLAGLRAAVQLLSDQGRDAEATRLRQATMDEIGHLEHLVCRESAAEPVEFAVDQVVDSVVQARRATGLRVRTAPSAIRARGVPGDLATVLQNLLVNAHLHGRGKDVDVTVTVAGGCCEIRVSDAGPGIPEAERDLVFQPGHVGRDSHGSGLGLHIARTLMREQGGDVVVRTRPADRQGVELAVVLPLASSREDSGPVPSATVLIPTQRLGQPA